MAGLIPPHLLDQIRHANDIVDVVGAVVPLKRAGANFVGLCPFHREKSPSFNVNPHRQIFHCFGCHKGGDVFTFVREYENLTFVEAVKRLADRANIVLELNASPGEAGARHLKDTLLQMHEQIAQRWQGALQTEAGGQIARDYLARRGVSPEAVKLFRIGYSPDAWDDTVNWARNKGYEPAIVEQAGLIIRKEGTDRYYDRFRGRLMFPICDEQGRVIAFSGRVLAGDEKTAKYVNSPETPIFRKGRVFYGLDKAKRPILDAGFAIICEGQLDLIACHSAGVANVVAPQGTAFTPDHARVLKRYVNEVVLCFDSDSAGQNAAVRVFDSLLEAGLAVRVATVPKPHDPDSFIKEFGGPAFQELIDGAEGFFDYYLALLCRANDVSQDKGRLAVVRDMSDALRKTGSLVLADTYAQKVAFRLAVTAEAVRAEFQRAMKAPGPGPSGSSYGSSQGGSGYSSYNKSGGSYGPGAGTGFRPGAASSPSPSSAPGAPLGSSPRPGSGPVPGAGARPAFGATRPASPALPPRPSPTVPKVPGNQSLPAAVAPAAGGVPPSSTGGDESGWEGWEAAAESADSTPGPDDGDGVPNPGGIPGTSLAASAADGNGLGVPTAAGVAGHWTDAGADAGDGAGAGGEVMTPVTERESWLLRLLLGSDDWMDWVSAHLDASWVDHPMVRRITEARLEAHRQGAWHGVGGLIEALGDPTASALITQAVAAPPQKGDLGRNLNETIRLVRNDALDRENARLQIRLASPGLPEDEMIAILRRQAEMRGLKKQPLQPLQPALNAAPDLPEESAPELPPDDFVPADPLEAAGSVDLVDADLGPAPDAPSAREYCPGED